MSVYSPIYHAMVFSPAPAGVHGAPVPQPGTGDDGESFFHHVLDIVNPLQHLPVVGTIYRAITGEHIGTVEKIAGDALYGGLWGAAASVAGVAFEAITGKSPEDTALAWLKGDDTVGVASAKVQPAVIAADASLPSADLPGLPSAAQAVAANTPDAGAFASALAAKGINGDMANRALYAYRQSMAAAPQPVFASVN